jgi:hypothetical protein
VEFLSLFLGGRFTLTHKKKIALCATLVWLIGWFVGPDWVSHVVPENPVGPLTIFVFLYLAVPYVVARTVFGWSPFKSGRGKPDSLPKLDPEACHPDAPADVALISKQDDSFRETIYPIGVLITGFITFIVTWIYCIATYGFLLGVGLGWLPSIIVAYIVGYLWPLILVGLIGIILLFWFNK